MAKNYRAGGQWAKPWNTMDRVRSNIVSSIWMLRREVPDSEYALLTADEVDLLHHLREALAALERVAH